MAKRILNLVTILWCSLYSGGAWSLYTETIYGGPVAEVLTPVAPSHLDMVRNTVVYRISSSTGPAVREVMQVDIIDHTVHKVTPDNQAGHLSPFYVSSNGRFIAYTYHLHKSVWISDRLSGTIRQVQLPSSLYNAISYNPVAFSPDDKEMYIRLQTRVLVGLDLTDPDYPTHVYAGAQSVPYMHFENGDFLAYKDEIGSDPMLAVFDPATRQGRGIYEGIRCGIGRPEHISQDESFAIFEGCDETLLINFDGSGWANLTDDLGNRLPGGSIYNTRVYNSWLGPQDRFAYITGSVDLGRNNHLYRIDLETGDPTLLSNIPLGGNMIDGALGFYEASDAVDSRYYFTAEYESGVVLFEGETYGQNNPVQITTLPHRSSSIQVSPDGKLLFSISSDHNLAVGFNLETGESYIHSRMRDGYALDIARGLIFKNDYIRVPEGYQNVFVVQPIDGSSAPIPLLYNDVRTGGFQIYDDLGNGRVFIVDPDNVIGVGYYTYIFDVNRNFLYGDLDGDGDIDDADLGLAIVNFSGPVGEAGGKAVFDGDVDGDGDVDDTDLGAAISGFTGPLSPQSVPEPVSVVLLCGVGIPILVGRRRPENNLRGTMNDAGHR